MLSHTMTLAKLAACLEHLLATAGNYRILAIMAAELLSAAARQELPQLDEKLYFLGVAQAGKAAPKRHATR